MVAQVIGINGEADEEAEVIDTTSDILEEQGAAKLLKVSVSWVQKAAARGDIPSFKVGARRRYRRTSLLRWAEQREAEEARR